MPRLSRPSVSSLLVQLLADGEPLGCASAFTVERPEGALLVTARHVVRGRHQHSDAPLHPSGRVPDTLAIAHNVEGRPGHWVWKSEPLYDGGRPRWREHPTLGAAVDVVAIPLHATVGVRLYPYDPEHPGLPIAFGVSSALEVVGFPIAPPGPTYLAAWCRGLVASEPRHDFNGLPCFLLDARTAVSHAGSATVAYVTGGAVVLDDGSSVELTKPRGRFVGMYSGRLNADSDLGVVWKAAAIAEVVAAAT